MQMQNTATHTSQYKPQDVERPFAPDAVGNRGQTQHRNQLTKRLEGAPKSGGLNTEEIISTGVLVPDLTDETCIGNDVACN
jgi:hypothetical protein